MSFLKQIINYKFIWLISIALLPACKSTKYLDDSQFLIKDVRIEIKDKTNVQNKEELVGELTYFITQEKNKKFLWIPRDYIYLKYENAKDSSSFGKWLRKKGELPSIFDSTLTNQSTKAMQQYLRYKKGYYQAEVSYQAENKNKKSKVTYDITLHKRYTIKSITYFAKDTAIYKLIQSFKDESLVKVGEGLDADHFDLEKARITSRLQNQGYADFATNYIDIKGDSTNQNYTVDIIIEIYNPSNGKNHVVYRNGNVNVFTDYYNKQDTFEMQMQSVEGINFFTEQSYFIVRPEVIAKAIDFTKGDLTKRDDRISTYNKLANLGTYRFSEILPKPNALDSNVIDYDIRLTPHINKWTNDLGFDIFNSSLTSSNDSIRGRKFIGLGVSAVLENRNFLRGSEKFSLNGAVSTQIELSSSDPVRALTYGLNASILYPNFKDPFKLLKSLRRIRLVNNTLYEQFDKNATSNLGIGFNSVNFRNTYSINSVNASFGYRFTDRISKSLYFDQVRFSLNKYVLEPSFIEQTNNSEYILNSFKDNFFTGILFSNLSYNINFPKNRKGFSAALLTNLEFSGLEVMLANGIYNTLSGKQDTFKLGNFEFSKFAKIELDGRITKHFGKKNSLTGRLNLGIITPLVKNQSAPYIKQFSVGGPNSLRGWGIRTLGPGSLVNEVDENTIPYSQGDIKIEANLEYRFKVWWILEGALFADAGNIWALTDHQSDGGRFSSDFMNQMAIATGWGMRWDFTYFRIRFDFGYQVRRPYKSNNTHWVNWDGIKEQKLGNIQVAVNYPF